MVKTNIMPYYNNMYGSEWSLHDQEYYDIISNHFIDYDIGIFNMQSERFKKGRNLYLKFTNIGFMCNFAENNCFHVWNKEVDFHIEYLDETTFFIICDSFCEVIKNKKIISKIFPDGDIKITPTHSGIIVKLKT